MSLSTLSTLGAAKARWTVLAGLVALLAAGRAYAQTTPCQTDLDCPGAGCGGQVCIKSSGGAMCAEPNTSAASGAGDGWCASPDGGAAVDTNCKCHAQGATCDGIFCTFTIPPDGGTPGTGGAAGGAGGSGGSVDASGGGGKGGSGSGGTAAGTSGGGGGGCSVAGAPSAFGSGGAALLLAAAAVRMRRRHSRRRA